jgi:hypothetical protein
VSALPLEDKWLVDSGASSHMAYKREYFAYSQLLTKWSWVIAELLKQ